jgi:hypothetical protein
VRKETIDELFREAILIETTPIRSKRLHILGRDQEDARGVQVELASFALQHHECLNVVSLLEYINPGPLALRGLYLDGFQDGTADGDEIVARVL